VAESFLHLEGSLAVPASLWGQILAPERLGNFCCFCGRTSSFRYTSHTNSLHQCRAFFRLWGLSRLLVARKIMV